MPCLWNLLEVIITWISSDGSPLPVKASLHSLGRIPASARVPAHFTFLTYSQPIDTVVEITVQYHLLSDPETPISKCVTLNIPIVSPFSVGHEWSPRVHPDKWPSYFDVSEGIFALDLQRKQKPMGITQRWCLTTILSNSEARIDDVEGEVHRKLGTALVVDGWELEVVNIGEMIHSTPLQPPSEGLGISIPTLFLPINVALG